ncbi:MAG TPA: hypothetical protein VER33_21370 [Polyangiaceae bacterium]|nr:hypothetical protein [Polyangiaceae bacterium]
MLPQPVCSNAAGELLGGEPPLVVVRVSDDRIEIKQVALKWHGHEPSYASTPHANVPLGTSAARVAELIAGAWGKRIAQYRWCPRCQSRNEPEHMTESVPWLRNESAGSDILMNDRPSPEPPSASLRVAQRVQAVDGRQSFPWRSPGARLKVQPGHAVRRATKAVRPIVYGTVEGLRRSLA